MSARCRRWAAALLISGTAFLNFQSASAGDPTRQGSSPPSPTDCIPVYRGTTAGTGELRQVDAEARIECPRDGNTAPYGSRVGFTDSVADGTVCTVLYYAPVALQDFPRYIAATWKSPGGEAAAARLDPESDGVLVSESGQKAPGNDIYAVYAREGTIQADQCQPNARWVNFCREGAPRATDSACAFAQPHPVTPATSPPPPIGPYVAQVAAGLAVGAGSVASLPSPNGLVNLPTCFWLDGVTIPDERDFRIVLPGAPDQANRRIYYTYLIRVFFGGVEWNFDDPYGNDQVAPHPACGEHPQLTAHSYQMISEKWSQDGFYHVVATERYQVTVDLYWDDSYGPHHQTVDPGIPLPITVSPPGPYNQYVGQVESIPMGR